MQGGRQILVAVLLRNTPFKRGAGWRAGQPPDPRVAASAKGQQHSRRKGSAQRSAQEEERRRQSTAGQAHILAAQEGVGLGHKLVHRRVALAQHLGVVGAAGVKREGCGAGRGLAEGSRGRGVYRKLHVLRQGVHRQQTGQQMRSGQAGRVRRARCEGADFRAGAGRDSLGAQAAQAVGEHLLQAQQRGLHLVPAVLQGGLRGREGERVSGGA